MKRFHQRGVNLAGDVPELDALLETSYLLYRQPVPDLEPGEVDREADLAALGVESEKHEEALMTLARERAEAVRDYLAGQTVP